jgi:hypothetical protein
VRCAQLTGSTRRMERVGQQQQGFGYLVVVCGE